MAVNKSVYERVLGGIRQERCTELMRQLTREKCVMWEEGSKCPEWVEKQLKSMKMNVKSTYPTAAQTDSGRIRIPPYPVIIGTMGKGRGRTLMLEGHYDTQFVDLSRWDYDPFAGEEVDGKIYGRGTVDSKGQMAPMFAAIEAIEASGIELGGKLIMACTPDGEYGGAGWRLLADNGLADETDWVIGGEATYWVEKDQFQVCNAHYGVYGFEITVIGKPTHYWRPQKEGVDAHWEMEHVISALGQLAFTHKPWKWFKPRLNLNSMQSNVQGMTVSCTLSGWVFTVPGMSLRSVRKDFKTCLDAVKERDGKLDYELLVFPRWDPTEVKEDSPVVTSLLEAIKAVHGKQGFTGVFELVHDAPPAIFSRANPGEVFGKPEAITFGGGDFRLAHIENEFIELKNLTDSAKIYARVILDLVG